jgi:hypothetical protein
LTELVPEAVNKSSPLGDCDDPRIDSTKSGRNAVNCGDSMLARCDV